ncbi:hypothetical protein LAZ67_10002381 [Cordylochernes scorpioides]|uniref:Uncharacterized protein n=1 Tax=Cordylochernes scorpioides TaxID=51811 RepID=A0ABY6KWN2_9ARAC|nr:hypothetical protein LAZ67_10002381 [Cordylochernes scorpioides]
MKKGLKGQIFEDLQEVKRAIKTWLRKQPPAYFQSGFTAWAQSWRKYIDSAHVVSKLAVFRQDAGKHGRRVQKEIGNINSDLKAFTEAITAEQAKTLIDLLDKIIAYVDDKTCNLYKSSSSNSKVYGMRFRMACLNMCGIAVRAIRTQYISRSCKRRTCWPLTTSGTSSSDTMPSSSQRYGK